MDDAAGTTILDSILPIPVARGDPASSPCQPVQSPNDTGGDGCGAAGEFLDQLQGSVVVADFRRVALAPGETLSGDCLRDLLRSQLVSWLPSIWVEK